MSLDAWLAIGIVVATFAALLATRLPPVTVFLGALTLSITFDLAPLDRSLAGFSNSGVLTNWRTVHGRRGNVFHRRHQPAER